MASTNTLYYDLKYYLSQGACLDNIDSKQRRAFRLNLAQYHFINDVILQNNQNGILQRCLEKDDSNRVLKELHDIPTSGNYGGETTTHKII